MKHPNCKLCYQQLHLKYLFNVARYQLQASWLWHDIVETCKSVIICEIIVHLLVIEQNNKRYPVHALKQNACHLLYSSYYKLLPAMNNLAIISRKCWRTKRGHFNEGETEGAVYKKRGPMKSFRRDAIWSKNLRIRPHPWWPHYGSTDHSKAGKIISKTLGGSATKTCTWEQTAIRQSETASVDECAL